MDAVERQLDKVVWLFADKDEEAVSELRRRLVSAARRQNLPDYSALVDGITFRVGSINRGQPYQIDTSEWTGLDRRMIGDFLGFLSAESYRANRFMISALVIGKTNSLPSQHFFDWMRELGILKSGSEDAILRYWADQVRRILDHYRRH